MSIASEITRISGNIADAYTALNAKGATMPAAESQNSANLADTIDSVPTGGGAVDFSAYDAMVEEAAELFTPYVSNYTLTKKAVYDDSANNGWYVPKSKRTSTDLWWIESTYGAVIYVFNNLFSELDLVLSQSHIYKFSPGCTILDNSDETNGELRVKFNTEVPCYILCDMAYPYRINSLGTCVGSLKYMQDTTATGNELSADTLSRLGLDYFYTAMCTKTYTASNPYVVSWDTNSTINSGMLDSYSSSLKAFGISKNIKYNLTSFLTSSSTYFLTCFNFPKSMSLVDFFEDHVADATYQETSLSTNLSERVLADNLYLWKREDFPFIIDLSASASTGTMSMGYSNALSGTGTTLGNPTIFTNYKMKIPATKSVVDLSGGNYDKWIYPETLQYIAANAPSVTGSHKIALGYAARVLAKECPEAFSTLAEKGWTIRAY